GPEAAVTHQGRQRGRDAARRLQLVARVQLPLHLRQQVIVEVTPQPEIPRDDGGGGFVEVLRGHAGSLKRGGSEGPTGPVAWRRRPAVLADIPRSGAVRRWPRPSPRPTRPGAKTAATGPSSSPGHSGRPPRARAPSEKPDSSTGRAPRR